MVYELMPHQDEFLYSKSVHTALVGGFGCGKSFIGVLKTVSKKLEYPSIDVAYYLPTYPLIRDIAFAKFTEVLENQNIEFSLNRTEKEFLTPFGRIILRSMDNPDLIIGYEVGYSCIDEADVLPKSKMNLAFNKIVARNRSKTPDEINSTDFVSTPEGFKFLYEFFVTNAKDGRTLIKGKTTDNKHLPESYIETLRNSYTEQQLSAYINGEFVNLTSGTVYHHYDREENHTDKELENNVMHVGMDFNIGNMAAIIHVIHNGIKYAVKEIIGAYDTSSVIEQLLEIGNTCVIYPDASGSGRNTSGRSDIQLLKEAGFTVIAPKKNPPVRDRVNAMNNSFMDNKGNRTYFVNSHNCPRYAQALEAQAYKNGEPDKTSGHDHATDAGGYFVFNSSISRTRKGSTRL